MHASVFDSFLARLVGQVERLRVGDALDEASDIGALINRTQYERVCAYLDEGLAAGARAITGGPDGTGYFLRPTILRDVDPSWRLAREEVFGPVLVALPWTDEREMINQANDSHYGLAAYIWTRDLSAALRTADQLTAGWIQINRGGGQLPGMSYGGMKHSGVGREYSIEGAVESFTQRKSVTIGLTADNP